MTHAEQMNRKFHIFKAVAAPAMRVLDCKLDQSKDIVEFGTLSQFDVDAESQYF